jgi:hypothetical protein
MSSLLTNVVSFLMRWPTAFHLWCAERELRMSESPTADLRQARERNLDLLRAYRLRGEFPSNVHDKSRLAPCFVDSDGRQCAVAFLMDQSGAKAAMETVASQANFARIGEMQFSELETWASMSGLTNAELARIQPGYPPTPEQAAKYAEMILSVGIVGGLAMVSVLFNVGRLLWALPPRLTTIGAGIVIGIVLICLGFWVNTSDFIHTPSLYGRLVDAQLFSIGIGMLAVVCAIIPLCVRRGKWKPTALDTDNGVSSNSRSKPESEHVKDLKYGPFKPPD